MIVTIWWKLTAVENGFVSEGKGLTAVDLERRMMSSLSHTAKMVCWRVTAASPRCSSEAILAQRLAVRLWWFTKVYEHSKGDEVKRKCSVACITRPRTREANACLCFTLMSGIPRRDPDMCWSIWERCARSSRSQWVAHGLYCGVSSSWLTLWNHWTMACKCSVFLSTRLRRHNRCTGRCLKSPHSETMVASRHDVRRQPLVNHLSAEDTTKSALVPHVPDAERNLLLTKGVLGGVLTQPSPRGLPPGNGLQQFLCWWGCQVGCAVFARLVSALVSDLILLAYCLESY